ncbi:hypothetical protein [Novacetimonas hansenii]
MRSSFAGSVLCRGAGGAPHAALYDGGMRVVVVRPSGWWDGV